MRPFRSLFLLLAALALTVVTACGTTPGQTPAAGGSAPGPGLEFSSRTLDGAEFSGQSLAARPAVLWFWAPWCSTCRAEAPTVANAAAQNPEVSFVGVAALDQLPAMQQFVAEEQLGGFPHLADTDASVWRHFGITQQPAFAFVSPDGSVEVVRSTLSASDLAQRLDALTRT
jgi:thiol-disulfide isomerase/thioredoxin